MNKIRMPLYALVFLSLNTYPVLAQKQNSIPSPDKIISDSSSTYTLLFNQIQKRSITTGSVAEIYNPQLQKTTSAFFGGLLTGRLAGLYTLQSGGEPGNDNVGLSLRGQVPFVMVDGTPQSFNSLNPEQIESVTVLKDAISTAMLGMRSSGNVILITTKKGAEGAPKIQFNAIGGIQQPLKMPRFLNAYDYGRLYNEALANDGKAPIYTQADLDAFQNGTDPIGHPNVDWQKQVLKDHAFVGRYDVTVSGGSSSVRYFANLDYLNQQGLFKTIDKNVYNTGSEYKRYIFRSNVSVDLNKTFTTFLNLFTRVQNFNEPGAFTPTIFENFKNTPNSAYNVLNTDSSLGGNRDYTSNIYGQTVLSGYRPSYSRDFKVDLGLKANLDKVVKGLWVRGTIAINAYLLEAINRSKNLVVFQQNKNAAGNPVYQQYGTIADQNNSITVNTQNRRFYTELAAGYSKQMDKHGIDALVLASNDNNMENTDLDYNYRGVSAKISYNYNQKYLAEVAVGYNSNDRYPTGHRYGLFPAFGVGWNITRENFLAGKPSWINDIKIRGSVGKTGNADIRYYAYNQYYLSYGSSYNFGETSTPVTGVTQDVLANPNFTWAKALKYNIGFDANLFKNKVTLNIDYFTNRYYDLLQSRGASVEILGTNYPDQNIGKNNYSGVELQLAYENHIGKFNYFISPNISTLKTRVVFQDEIARPYEWMYRTNQPVGQRFGYIAEGLFQSVAEVNSSAKPVGMTVLPGDIKFKDLNADGVIDTYDQTAIGTTKPLIYYGVTMGANWKGLDINILLQGVQNRDVYLSGNNYWEFQNNGRSQAYEHHLNRWTPSNPNATYPRLTVGTNLNNSQTSSYWIKSGNYMRLKNLELGYSFPTKLAGRVGFSSARIFLNGTNLLTFSSLKDRDPENTVYNYPIQRVLVAGINLKF
jgi:TonB-linked SusC/RagA family outer membrane protein